MAEAWRSFSATSGVNGSFAAASAFGSTSSFGAVNNGPSFAPVSIPKASGFASTKAFTLSFSSSHHCRSVEESCTEVVVTESGV